MHTRARADRETKAKDGSSTLASGSAAASVGFMLLQPMPLADYATKFTSALRAYKTALMSTPCVCRQSAVEADVAAVVAAPVGPEWLPQPSGHYDLAATTTDPRRTPADVSAAHARKRAARTSL